MSANELGRFLRARREAIDPATVGLPAGARRRTPGLRRSEVAALAGVSVEYVTRLEQGRDKHPSGQVLGALADTLRLTANERIHLYRLTKSGDPDFLCRGDAGPGRVVRPTVRALLDRLDIGSLVNQLGDVVAHTEGYARLFDTGQTNLLRYVFTDPRARTVFPDWAAVADQRVAELKAGPFRADPYVAALADELSVTGGEEFTRRVDTVPGYAHPTGVLRIAHPALGELRLAYETLELPADDGLRLVVHLPADAATAAALRGPAGRTPLRLVSG